MFNNLFLDNIKFRPGQTRIKIIAVASRTFTIYSIKYSQRQNRFYVTCYNINDNPATDESLDYGLGYYKQWFFNV